MSHGVQPGMWGVFGVISDLNYALHRGVLAEPAGTIAAALFSEFQLIFEATVCAIAVSDIYGEGRILPLILFLFARTAVYPLFMVLSTNTHDSCGQHSYTVH